jgi:NAD-dependent dihydropyrimidine dehydrogenase PreA subunit
MSDFAVITSPCIGVKDGACVQACPVDCIQEGADQFFVYPDECIDCGGCVIACPTGAIYMSRDLPDDQIQFVQKARDFFKL